MARKDKQSYITIPHEGVKPQWVKGVSTEELLASSGIKLGGLGTAEVSYRLENIAEDARNKSPQNRTPIALLVSHNISAIRPVALRARDYRLEMRHAYAGPSKNMHAEKGICLADTHSKTVFDNSFAVFQAVEECHADVVLLIDSALEDDEVFLGLMQGRGIEVYRCVMADATWDTWIKCERTSTQDEVSWTKCPNCDLLFDDVSLTMNHQVCPNCGAYYRMNSKQRIDDLVDVGSFAAWDTSLPTVDPLEFPGYVEKIEALREKTELDEAVCTGRATIAGLPLALCVMDSQFLMGSMGSIVGEKITRAIERATQEGLPVVIFTASGGARMQEGLISLMQMAKVTCALAKHSDAGNLFISVLTDPTTGGVTASFAMQGDIVLAEPKTMIGFAGQRVIKSTINQDLPEGFQTAEFALEHGLIDAIVERQAIRERLAHLLGIHKAQSDDPTMGNGEQITYQTLCEHVKNKEGRYRTAASVAPSQMRKALRTVSEKVSPSGTGGIVSTLFGRRKAKEKQARSQERLNALLYGDQGNDEVPTGKPSVKIESPDHAVTNPAWENVKIARNQNRPTSRHYIDSVCEGFFELHGDRGGGDDGAIICGLAWIGSQPVTIVAQEKGVDLKDRLARNFGCPQPWGYRKSLRIMKQAAKFGRPVVCLVDTSGAYPGLEAEEQGQGNAIAENLAELATLPVPVISVIVGEGGSGGALALALADRVAMLEHAIYSILSPEGFASILWKDKTRAPEAAAAMKISAREAHELGVIDEVLSEGDRPAHENADIAAARVRSYLVRTLDELSAVNSYHLVEQRQRRFRKF